jgi:hypothetical protein
MGDTPKINLFCLFHQEGSFASLVREHRMLSWLIVVRDYGVEILETVVTIMLSTKKSFVPDVCEGIEILIQLKGMPA